MLGDDTGPSEGPMRLHSILKKRKDEPAWLESPVIEEECCKKGVHFREPIQSVSLISLRKRKKRIRIPYLWKLPEKMEKSKKGANRLL